MGAQGYLLKTSSNEDLLDACNSENFFYGEGVKNKERSKIFQDQFLVKNSLTAREIEIIQLLSKDYNSEIMADKLCVSVHTINTHRRNIKAKLNVSTIAGIVAFGYENKII